MPRLRKIYVRHATLLTDDEHHRREEHAQSEAIAYEDIITALNRMRRAVLLGEPGAGKTTTLFKMAKLQADAAVEDPSAPLSILVRLVLWTNADHPLDKRPGVGLTDDGLPDIVWIDVPGKKGFVAQTVDAWGDPDVELGPFDIAPFRMAKYPVTYTQYRAFVEADDGFHNPQWWEGLAAGDDHKAQPGEQAFPFDNHPAERVSWWDSVAFCRWLSSRTGLDIRLPTEWEWQWAAQGDTGQAYPYGSEFDATKANVGETGIGQTSAVGIFPQGASPFGVLDMSGNVWEWCLNEYDTPENIALGGGALRVVRGGSFVNNDSSTRAVNRDRLLPQSRFNSQGFRLCVSLPS